MEDNELRHKLFATIIQETSRCGWTKMGDNFKHAIPSPYSLPNASLWREIKRWWRKSKKIELQNREFGSIKEHSKKQKMGKSKKLFIRR